MILFQLDRVLLFKDIKNFEYEIQETLDTYTIRSPNIEGDRRNHRNRSPITKLICKGKIETQHLIHYLRSIQEDDNGEGNTKCFFIEKYNQYSADYYNIDSPTYGKDEFNSPNEYEYRVYFNYCYIDIVAINPIKKKNKLEYNIEFTISLCYPNNFEITNLLNTYIVNRNSTENQILWDNNELYDTTINYDEYLDSLSKEYKQLQYQAQYLAKYYDDITCCTSTTNQGGDYNYIYHVDKIIRPFILENFYHETGTINKYIDGGSQILNTKDNFFLTALTNPLDDNRVITKQSMKSIRNEDIPQKVNTDIRERANINIISNTYTENGIIQLFRNTTNFNPSNTLKQYYCQPINGVQLTPLFDKVGQEIQIQVRDSARVLSDIVITIRNETLMSKIKMLIIHPHNQKLYAIFENYETSWLSQNPPNSTRYLDYTFGFKTKNNQLQDLETYLLDGDITIVNNTFDSQAWLSFSPSYKRWLDDERKNNTIFFSTRYPDGSKENLKLNIGMFMMIECYTENKLI